MSHPPPLIAVLGATATGKTALAATLAEGLGGEVLSCDASCVYRGLDVGTAKPDARLRRLVPHRLLDLCEPEEDFNAARWLAAAEACLRRLEAAGRVAVVAGGTGLYLRLLLKGLADSPPPDAALRRRLLAREPARPGSLGRLLARLDPAAGRRCSARQVHRQVRALEHLLSTGRPPSADRKQWSSPGGRPAVKIGLRLPRDLRAVRIEERVDAMIRGGLVAEVAALLAGGLDPAARSLRAIGYREAVAHLEGRLSLDELRERMVVATRRFAKRQDTWFRKEEGVRWFAAAESPSELPALLERVMMTLPRGFEPRPNVATAGVERQTPDQEARP